MDAERLIEIETKLAYQEDLIQELNNIVHMQQTRLEQLEAAYKLLASNFASLTAQDGPGHPVDEKPPHY